MAHWYSVYHNEEYEAEIRVGLHQRWLQQLDFGPTQADRVLVHTDMMEHAQERRFAVCEASLNMASFETNHSHRIKQAIDHLQLHFTANTSREMDDAVLEHDDILIGLASHSPQDMRHDCSQFATADIREEPVPMQSELQRYLWESLMATILTGPESEENELMIDVSENEDVDSKQDLGMELLMLRKKMSQGADGPRQRKDIRRRGGPRGIVKSGGPRDGKTVKLKSGAA